MRATLTIDEILSHYYYKEWIQDELRNISETTSGSKGELVARFLGSPRIRAREVGDIAVELLKKLRKRELNQIAADLGFEIRGNRKILLKELTKSIDFEPYVDEITRPCDTCQKETDHEIRFGSDWNAREFICLVCDKRTAINDKSHGSNGGINIMSSQQDSISIRIFGEIQLRDYLSEKVDTIPNRISELKDSELFGGDLEAYTKKLLLELSDLDFVIHFDRKNVRVDTKDIPGWKFPKSFKYQFISHSKTYRKQVVIINIPFNGNPEILRCIPQEYKPWTMDVQVCNNDIQFELIDYEDNDEKIKSVIKRLLDLMEFQYSSVKKDLASFRERLQEKISLELDRRIAEVQRQDGLAQSLGYHKITISEEIGLKDRPDTHTKPTSKDVRSFEHDVAISYAGEDLTVATSLCQEFKNCGIKVFFAPMYKSELWGKDLSSYLKNKFSKNSRFVLILVSKHYVVKDWTDFEFSVARIEAEEREADFILPVRIDDTPLPGLRSTMDYVDLRKQKPKEIAEMLAEKISHYSLVT